MSLMGYTPGGSPIFFNNGKTKHGPIGKKMYVCSKDVKHKLTSRQAKSSGGFCTHCGHWLEEMKPRKRSDFSPLEQKIYDLQMELEREKVENKLKKKYGGI